MTAAAKFTYITALIAGLCLGLPWGFRTANFALDIGNDVQRIGAVEEFRDFSYRQYKHADSEHAKEALLMYVKFLEEMRRFRPESMQQRELGITYTRLALLEDAGNNPERSRAYMEKVNYWYRTGGGRDYSESEMKTRLKEFDDHQQQ
jgi:hypothetical protein